MEWYISLQSLEIARESANWTFVSMLAAIASAVISLITLIVAWRALNSWRMQEAIMERKNLIKAYLHYQRLLMAAPHLLTPDNPDQLQLRHVNSLHDACIDIRACIIVMMDGKSHEKYGKDYQKLLPSHQAYIAGEISKDVLASVVRGLVGEDFFNR